MTNLSHPIDPCSGVRRPVADANSAAQLNGLAIERAPMSREAGSAKIRILCLHAPRPPTRC